MINWMMQFKYRYVKNQIVSKLDKITTSPSRWIIKLTKKELALLEQTKDPELIQIYSKFYKDYIDNAETSTYDKISHLKKLIDLMLASDDFTIHIDSLIELHTEFIRS